MLPDFVANAKVFVPSKSTVPSVPAPNKPDGQPPVPVMPRLLRAVVESVAPVPPFATETGMLGTFSAVRAPAAVVAPVPPSATETGSVTPPPLGGGTGYAV
jgi:hypothetical protein